MRTFQAATALLVVVFAAPAPPTATYASVLTNTVTQPSCNNGAFVNCSERTYESDTLANASSTFLGSPILGGTPATFTTAFSAWDAANGNAWKLVNGGTLNLTISPDVSVGVSSTNNWVAGLSALFTISGESAFLIPKLVWTQALVVNYSPLTGPLSRPIQTLDTFSFSQDGSNPSFPTSCSSWSNGAGSRGATFCGPIYPFQYGTSVAEQRFGRVAFGDDPFYDVPQGNWPDASFEAFALLSEVNPATDTLTVYQGIEYGFQLAVPEAATWAMVELGFAGFGFAVARRRSLVSWSDIDDQGSITGSPRGPRCARLPSRP